MKVIQKIMKILKHLQNENLVLHIRKIQNVRFVLKINFNFIWKFKGLKKKRQHFDSDENDDDEQSKTSEPKRRGQTFAKPQEESTGMQDIKSMFAATKTRTAQKQEQVYIIFFFFLFFNSIFRLESKRWIW